MNGIDIHVLSSKYGEAFPNVLGEAMASGTPCVVTDVGDSSLIVDKTGWVVQPNNPRKLASNLKSAILQFKNKGWVNICKNARKRIDNRFSIKSMNKNYNDVWKNISIKKN